MGDIARGLCAGRSAHCVSPHLHGQHLAKRVHLLRYRPVVHPGAVLARRDEPGFAQHLEVMADGWLALADRGGEVAGAHLAGRRCGDDAQQPKAHWVRQRLEGLRQLGAAASSSGSLPRGAQHEASARSGSDVVMGATVSINVDECIDRSRTMGEHQYIDIHQCKESAVTSLPRVQLALNVSDVDAAVDFYSRLFGAEPHKRRPGYANFALGRPSAQAGPHRECGGRRRPQPPRRRGRRHR